MSELPINIDPLLSMDQSTEETGHTNVPVESETTAENKTVIRKQKKMKERDLFQNFFHASSRKIYPSIKIIGGMCGGSRYQLYKKGAKSRRNIDRRTTGGYFQSIFGAHTSECGWNLPKKHPRHLLNLPIEILRKILSFMLVTPYEVTPTVIPCNWYREIHEPSYSTGLTGTVGVDFDDWDIVHAPGFHATHKDGPKTYAGWTRRPLDATVLRVCKLLRQEGMPLLYGENEFVFNLNHRWMTGLYNKRPHHESVDENGEVVYHSREMPDDIDDEEVQEDIRDMVNVQNPQDLPDWIFCDPFARFIYSIGPTNASFIRKLRIVGSLLAETPGSSYSWEKKGSLSFFLTAYTPFILRYCQNLTKFGIGIEKIIVSDDDDESGHHNWFGIDPEDADKQAGDKQLATKLGKDAFKLVKFSREERRHRKIAVRLLELENDLAPRLKPYLDETIPQMKRLQHLEVKRWPIKEWDDFYYRYAPSNWNTRINGDAPRKPDVSWYPSTDDWGRKTRVFMDMDIADDAKAALVEAVLARSKEMEAGKQLAGLSSQDTTVEGSSFTSQRDLPDHPLALQAQRGGAYRGRGGRGRGGWGRGDGNRGGRNRGSSYRGRGGARVVPSNPATFRDDVQGSGNTVAEPSSRGRGNRGWRGYTGARGARNN